MKQRTCSSMSYQDCHSNGYMVANNTNFTDLFYLNTSIETDQVSL